MNSELSRKNLHLKHDDKIHVIRMIQNGASLREVSEWYEMRFGNSVTRYGYIDVGDEITSLMF